MVRLNVFDERRRLSFSREKKNRKKHKSKERERKHKEREEKRTKKRKKSSPSLFVFALLFLSSLSCFFFGSPFSLSLKSFSLSGGGVSRFPLSRNSDESAREVFRERHFAAQKRARFNARKERERERERERDERESASEHSLPTEVSLLCSFSPPLPRGINHHTETEYSFLSENRKLACFPWETIIMRTKRRRKNHRRR